ncbi:MAG TPA: hypothetical protein VGM44_10615 [Polyangiaceae bacterium]|jgi:hypothetical protein
MIIRIGSHARSSLVFLGLVLTLPVALAACGSTSDGADDSNAGAASNPRGGSGSIGAGGQVAQAGGVAAAGTNPGGVAGGNAAGSGSSSGGTSSVGGSNGSAGHAGTSSGGSSAGNPSGGTASGGSASAGGASAGSANGGSSSAGSGGSAGSAPSGKVFSQARFHFGTIDSKASGNSSMISQLDFFTSGWLQANTFDHKSVCDETKSGAAFANQVPVMVSYIAAAHVKSLDKTVCDCNVTTSPCVAANDLCHVGAQRIQQDFTDIVNAYKSYSSGFAACYGTTRPIVFEMEPDWYQYTVTTTQSQAWTPQQAGQMMGQLVAALKTSLPNAVFSIDVSPWVGSNGTDNGKAWYANFDMTQFTFVNTSGGGTNANTEKIRSSNNMTWSGLNQVTGKPILADTGYGANGQAVGEDPLWDMASNINARIADGVVSISQYNPNSNWGSTISGLRSQLNTPKTNP